MYLFILLTLVYVALAEGQNSQCKCSYHTCNPFSDDNGGCCTGLKCVAYNSNFAACATDPSYNLPVCVKEYNRCTHTSDCCNPGMICEQNICGFHQCKAQSWGPPTMKPTTNTPNNPPSFRPSFRPSSSPTTEENTIVTTMKPTMKPTINPTMKPTMNPTMKPISSTDTNRPTFQSISTAAPSKSIETFKPTLYSKMTFDEKIIIANLSPGKTELQISSKRALEEAVAISMNLPLGSAKLTKLQPFGSGGYEVFVTIELNYMLYGDQNGNYTQVYNLIHSNFVRDIVDDTFDSILRTSVNKFQAAELVRVTAYTTYGYLDDNNVEEISVSNHSPSGESNKVFTEEGVALIISYIVGTIILTAFVVFAYFCSQNKVSGEISSTKWISSNDSVDLSIQPTLIIRHAADDDKRDFFNVTPLQKVMNQKLSVIRSLPDVVTVKSIGSRLNSLKEALSISERLNNIDTLLHKVDQVDSSDSGESYESDVNI